MTNSEIRNIINEFVHSERDREILKRRFIDGIKYELLAEEYDLSRAQIIRIVKRWEMALK